MRLYKKLVPLISCKQQGWVTDNFRPFFSKLFYNISAVILTNQNFIKIREKLLIVCLVIGRRKIFPDTCGVAAFFLSLFYKVKEIGLVKIGQLVVPDLIASGNVDVVFVCHRLHISLGNRFAIAHKFAESVAAKTAAGKELTEEESCKLLSAVGLCAEDYLNRQLDGTLSGGEMKRIEIATVLAKSHKVSIFDEPEAGIDLWSFSMLIRRFEEIHREKKECLILISHQEKIINMADKIMVIEDGEVTKYGTKEEVFPTLFQQEKCQKCLTEGGNC